MTRPLSIEPRSARRLILALATTFAITGGWNIAVIVGDSRHFAPVLTGAAVVSGVDTVRQALRRALARAGQDDFEAADRELRAAIGHPAFNQLSSKEQHSALALAADIALRLGHNVRAHPLFVRTTGMSEAKPEDWVGRLDAAIRLRDYVDAVACVTLIARRWPETLASINDSVIPYLAREAKKFAAKPHARLDLITALYEANWQMEYEQEPSLLWRDLAQSLLARQQIKKAIDVGKRITDPYVLIGMKVDRRFEAIAAANPSRFDVERAADERIEQWRARAQESPRTLELVVHRVFAMLDRNQAAEVLALTDDVLARVSPRGTGASPYDDATDQLVWIMDSRARALKQLNRWPEAAEQLESARQAYGGDSNFAQSINLGLLYMEFDRPKEALASVASVTTISGYARTQVEAVRAGAGAELNDGVAMEQALTQLRELQIYSPQTLQESLVRANRIEEAARLLVERLADPERRCEALLAVQRFPEPPAIPRLVEWRARWVGIVARPEVQAAIVKAGRVESFRIAAPQDY